MPLNLRITENRSFSRTLHLDGQLNNQTVAAVDQALAGLAASPATVVALDLAGLTYLNSEGLRSIFRFRKTMAARGGQTLLVNPQPQVQKVLEIVNAVDVSAVFASIEELDAYLDVMQRRVVEGQ